MAKLLIDTTQAPIQWEPQTAMERIAQNAKNLLMLRMGEVPYDRLRGLTPDVYDKPLKYVEANIQGEMERVLAWEPDVTCKRVQIAQTVKGTVFLCEVEIREELIDRIIRT